MTSFVRRGLAVASLLVAAAFVPGEATADAPLPTPGQPQVNVYSVPGSNTPKVVVRAVLAQPPRKVWAVVSDCSKYSVRMPRVAKSRLVSKVGNKHTCEVTLSLPFPLSNLTAVTEAIHTESERKMSRRWKLVSGDYSINNGSWEVEAADAAGTTSLVTYSVQAEPTTAVPDFVRAQAQKKALPELIERVGTEAAKIP